MISDLIPNKLNHYCTWVNFTRCQKWDQESMAGVNLVSPEPFSFNNPEMWPQWIRRFERFRQASELRTQSSESQVNYLIYSMGDQADDILSSFDLTVEQKKVFDTVKNKFEGYFVKKRNTIFERAKFNRRRQNSGEPVDSFITALYCLVEHCKYMER